MNSYSYTIHYQIVYDIILLNHHSVKSLVTKWGFGYWPGNQKAIWFIDL